MVSNCSVMRIFLMTSHVDSDVGSPCDSEVQTNLKTTTVMAKM